MILAEKIIKLRKEQGWSQEELAMRLDVTRQSVSKWESTASLPDLDKILRMSELFGVSTDYLLKDEAPPETGCINGESDVEGSVRTIPLEEANRYLSTVQQTSGRIANGVSLCILSPAPLILLTAAAEQKALPLSASLAASVGICALLILVAAAVALFVSNGLRLSRYEYLEKEPITTEYGVAGIVESRQREYEPVHKKMLVLGITLCIVSVLPLLAVATTGDEFLVCAATACIFPLVAVGVNLIVRTASVWGSYQKLLEAGDFTREKKAENKRDEPFVVFYWCLVLAVYLGLSFVTRRWDSTWIIWPVMAVLFGAALALKSMLQKKP
ncbi:MAG: helix-turn-helix transcriptional regulator [Oscillospiraceae bacterium]|nr:helix-turn-helix transcriptional regulator [Oscillospiraceae bacterium]